MVISSPPQPKRTGTLSRTRTRSRRTVQILLDTHILIWSLSQPSLLGRRAAEILEDDDTEVWLSPISIWECLVLAHKGKVSLAPDAMSWVRNVVRDPTFREARLNHEVAIASRLVELPQQDPADRFLAATAAVYDLTLLTADAQILEGRGFSALSND
jgi:PIN domain nuclease of toxin-antitoxin system